MSCASRLRFATTCAASLLFAWIPAVAAAAVHAEAIGTGFDQPVFVTHAFDDRLFVVENPGRIQVLPEPYTSRSTFLDISGLVSSPGERGLLSVAFHPNYASNRLFFVNYTNLQGHTVVARYTASAANPNVADAGGAAILLTITQPFSNHNGGQLQFGPDGYLYVGMGDGGSGGDPGCRAQAGQELLGKLLRLDVDQNPAVAPYYGIPSDNPFRANNDPGNLVRDEIWALGLRNPWRFSFDRGTGDLYIGDVGQGNLEEIDLEPAGSAGGVNYGWKVMVGSTCFSTSGCAASVPACDDPELTLPIFEYDHSVGCSVTGGYVYRGQRADELVGEYVYGDYCTGEVYALRRDGVDEWTNESILNLGFGVTSFGEGSNGQLYVCVGNSVLEVTSDPANPVSVLGQNRWGWLLSLAALLAVVGSGVRRRRS